MKITRKITKTVKEFYEIEKGETFLIGDTPYMKVDTCDAEIECDRCEDLVTLDSSYAVNLETGEFVEFRPYQDFEICECEVIVNE